MDERLDGVGDSIEPSRLYQELVGKPFEGIRSA
jgi:hypothetical protein